MGSGGGTLITPDGSMEIVIPPGAVDGDTTISITESGSGTAYELSTNLGMGIAVFGVDLQPEGVVFNVPITVTFNWDDIDNDGKIDGTNINEDNVRITKNNNVVTDKCKNEPGPLSATIPECDSTASYFSIQTTSLSEWTFWEISMDADGDGVPNDQDYWPSTSTTLMSDSSSISTRQLRHVKGKSSGTCALIVSGVSTAGSPQSLCK